MQNDRFKRGFRHMLRTGETHMSQTQSQTQPQTPKSFLNAPIYTREELKRKLRELNRKIERVREPLVNAVRAISDIHDILYFELCVRDEILEKLRDAEMQLKDAVYDAIDEMIVNELQLDVDIDKYEKQYNVKFSYDAERQLGVALLKENDTVKPVVIWTDYREVWYYEGERNE